MDFVILFGGIIYLAYKAIKEHYDEWKWHKEFFGDGELGKGLLYYSGKYAKDEECEAVKQRLKNPMEHSAIIEELRDVWLFVYGEDCDYRSRIKLNEYMSPEVPLRTIPNYEYWCYHMLLARQGKIDHSATLSGYWTGTKEYSDEGLRYCEYLQMILNEKGVIGNLVLKYSPGRGYTRYANYMEWAGIGGHHPNTYGVDRLW